MKRPPRSLRSLAQWLLWLWMALVIVGAFAYAPLAAKFIGQSSRILFFHVPMAWASYLGFAAAGIWSLWYLLGGRHPRHDRAARAAVELGLLFGVLATVTGALCARIMWGSYWNWDPRQTSIIMALIWNGAYLALRDAVEDAEKRARLAAAYAALGLAVTPFFFFIVPRITFSLHPDPLINTRGQAEMETRMLQVLLASGAGFLAIFFWMHGLRSRILALADRRSLAPDLAGTFPATPVNIATPATPASPANAASATRAPTAGAPRTTL